MNAFANRPWQQLGERPLKRLAESRLQLHWAVQAVAAVGNTLVRAAPDYSHTSLEWLPAASALTGQPANYIAPFRAGLRLADLTLLLIDGEGSGIGELALKGRTLTHALEWLARAIGGYTGQQLTVQLEPPDLELPPHPAGRGGAFATPQKEALAELAHWFANADALLRDLAGRTAGTAPVRCWPHHFDIATLISLDPPEGGEEARSIGVGMTPGDGSYPEPYWYVTPWPYPENPRLPELPGAGSWHREGWLGAVLPASRVDRGGAETQAAQAILFIDAAVAACRELLGKV